MTFATGTPISNSMTELYTIMRYLQYGTLQRLGLGQFDAWAATFGETQTAIELAPEGTGYRAKTRFAKFFNLPELIALFKEAADIQTADMLDLKIPDAEYENIVLKPSDAQKEMVSSLADRAETIRSGQIRFLLGSTAKMGAGTNVQDRLITLHHLDVPWRPSDIEQQEGRILRQGNTNPKVKIFRYVTEGTFDAYSWQVIENKQKFISQIMTSKSPVRSCDDIDETALTYAEVKALATGNPHIKEKMDLDIQVSKLKLLKANHTTQIYRLEDNIAKNYPKQIATLQERIEGYRADIATYQKNKPADKEQFTMIVAGKTYEDRKEAGAALIETCKGMKQAGVAIPVGEYMGMPMSVTFDAFDRKFTLSIKGQISHSVEIGSDPAGNIMRINNTLENMTARMEETVDKLANIEKQLATAKEEVTKPFPQEEELRVKSARLAELNSLLNMDEKDDSVLDVDEDAPKPVQTEPEKEHPEEKTQEEVQMEERKEYDGFDTPIEEHDHNETPPERADAEQMEQPQITESETNPPTAQEIASALDSFTEDVDPYNYKDVVEDKEAHIRQLTQQIMAGETDGVLDYLKEFVEEEAGNQEQIAEAKRLMEKINEYKPLAKVEEMEEQNYNMIDNQLSNGAGEKEAKREREKDADKPRERVHFKEKLKEMKEAAAQQAKGDPQKEKKPPLIAV